MTGNTAIIGVGNEEYDLEGTGSFVSTDGTVCLHISIPSVLANRNRDGAESSSPDTISRNATGCATSDPAGDVPARTKGEGGQIFCSFS